MIELVSSVGLETARVFYEASLYILVGFLVAGLLHEYVPTGLITRHLGQDSPRSVGLAALFGTPIPLCSCGVLPAAAALQKKGASRSSLLSFLVSTPETGVDSIALTYGLLGPVMAVVRPVVAIVTALVAGFVSMVLPEDEPPPKDPGGTDASVHQHVEDNLAPPDPGLTARVRRVLAYGFGILLDEISFWLVVGVVLTGVLSALLPDDFFSRVLGWESGLVPMLAMMVAGIPLYLCASASTPIAAALIAKGLSPGAALVFLLVGPATNAATIAVVGRLVGSRRLWVYLLSIAFVSLLAGVLLDAVGGDAVRRSALAGASAEHGAFAMVKLAAAMAFGVLLVLSFWRTRFGEGLAEARDQLRRLAALSAPVLAVGGLCFILLAAYMAREAGLREGGIARAPSSRAHVEVVTSIYPLELIVRALGGDRVNVSTLLPPGASPHTFEPLPGDVARLAGARYFVRAGGGLDVWAEKLTAVAQPSLETIVVLDLDAVDGLHSDERHDRHHEKGNGTGPIDPHIWLDPILVRDALIPGLLQRLIAADPGGAQEYRAGAARFAGNLTALDEEIRTVLAPAAARAYVAYHDSWRYFARRYGLETLGVVHEFAGEEPTPLELARLVSAARDAAVPAILVEPQFSPRVAQVIAAEFGGHTIQVDPLGTPGDPARSTYEGLMRYNAEAFARALGGEDT
jgi:ABC-type Zn uptake system ZnuABC Zn-binding protein ZnuA/uncharacterized membrane protein YraQ (UPF0718 family)